MNTGVSYAALDPDSEERFLPLRRMLGVTSFGLNQILLRPGQRVAPEVRRFVANRGDEDVLLIALGGAGEHSGRDGEAFESWEQQEGRPPQEVPLPADER